AGCPYLHPFPTRRSSDLAAGSIFGQVLLVAMLLVLPYTLVAVAFPNKDGGRAKMGTTLMRMTGLAFFIRTVFLLILGMSVHLARSEEHTSELQSRENHVC